MSMSAHQRGYRGATDTWLTPPEILTALGPFDLDPCAAPEPRPWPTAAEHYTAPKDDGLALPWHGLVWLNPPFGPEAGRWLTRLADHGTGVALVAARTETRWFVNAVWERSDAVLFLHGRPNFHHADGTRARLNSGAPICLVAYGPEAVNRLARSGLPGSLVPTWHPPRSPTHSIEVTA